jgi:hypothetical protein
MTEKGNVASEVVKVEGLTIVDARLEGEKLIVVVESDSIPKLIEGAARKLAYEERLKHGMAQAGIEAMGGTYVPETEQKAAKEGKRNVALWRADFRITPLL